MGKREGEGGGGGGGGGEEGKTRKEGRKSREERKTKSTKYRRVAALFHPLGYWILVGVVEDEEERIWRKNESLTMQRREVCGRENGPGRDNMKQGCRDT